LARDNAKALQKAGIEATPEMMYVAHQQGAGGAAQLVKYAKEGRTFNQLPAELQHNMAVNSSSGLSAQEYLDKWKKKYRQADAIANKAYRPQPGQEGTALAGGAPSKGLGGPSSETVGAPGLPDSAPQKILSHKCSQLLNE